MENKKSVNGKKNDFLLTNVEMNYHGDLPQLIYYNFIFEIGNYLLKNEKISLRQINKFYYHNTFPLFSLFLNMKPKTNNEEEYSSGRISFVKMFKNFSIIDKINLENLKMNKEILNGLDLIFTQNISNIKILSLVNIEYDGVENILFFQDCLNKLKNIEEFKIGNIGNRDKLFINLERNFKNLHLFNQTKTLKIDNIPLKQILYLIKSFQKIENLSIENCSLDEDLRYIEQILNKQPKISNLKLKQLNLSLNGLSSVIAMESLKKILVNQKNLENLTLRGMWFTDIYPLNEEFKILDKLTSVDLTGSKNAFTGLTSIYCFCEIRNLKVLNLGDSRIEDSDLMHLLQSLKNKNISSLEELNFFRCLLTDLSICNILDFSDLLKNLKILNLTFNHGITEKGFNKYLDNFFLLKSLKNLNLRNTGISLKYSLKNISNFVLNLALMKNPPDYIQEENKCDREIQNNPEDIDTHENMELVENINTNDVTQKKIFETSKIQNATKDKNGKNLKENLLIKKIDNKDINLQNLDLAFCTLYDNDYYSLIERILKTLNSNNIKGFLNLKIGLKIFNQKKPIFKKVENLQKELYQNYNLIIK